MRALTARRGVSIGILAWLLAADAASAQTKVSVTPFVGGLIPTKPMGQLRIGGLTPQPFTFRGEMKTAGAAGGRLDVWLGPRWGVEGSYFYAWSDFNITAGPFTATVDANVQGGAAKAFYQATSAGTGTEIVLSAGLAGVQHGGRAFSLASQQFDVGTALGAGLRVEMSPRVTFRLDGDALLYRWSAGPGFASTTQVDLLMTVGLALRFDR